MTRAKCPSGHIEAVWASVHSRRLTLSPNQASHSTNPGAFLSSTFGVTMRREACSDANAQVADAKVRTSRDARARGREGALAAAPDTSTTNTAVKCENSSHFLWT